MGRVESPKEKTDNEHKNFDLDGDQKSVIESEPIIVSTKKSLIEAIFDGEEIELGCYLCHDVDQTKSFHVPEKIIKIEDRENIRRRLCPDCHGLEGADPNRQMTDPRDIQFDANVGVSGLFYMSKGIPHAIHKRILVSGEMECVACHLSDPEDYNTFKMTIPKADTEDRQILLCQNCKFHPERGNYITIHVEIAGKRCNICHTGNLLEVHKRATEKLGIS